MAATSPDKIFTVDVTHTRARFRRTRRTRATHLPVNTLRPSTMAQDGCQPMERFAFAKNGSAQKSWAFCPSSRAPEYNGGAHPPGGVRGGTYEQRPYSVSGYVNGYNPSLPAYPPTRAQLEAQAAAARRPGPTGGRSGEISEMMSRQVEFERARGA